MHMGRWLVESSRACSAPSVCSRSGLRDPLQMLPLLRFEGGPIFFALVIPWGYVYRHYFKRPADRWS